MVSLTPPPVCCRIGRLEAIGLLLTTVMSASGRKFVGAAKKANQRPRSILSELPWFFQYRTG